MIFASDLDRTLIYSARALHEFGYPVGAGLKPVEKRDGEWVSFMTEASFKLLLEISQKYRFVPITTRTTSQFKRIEIFQKDIPLEYAITTNGAIILRNGKPLEEWTRVISSKIKKESAAPQELLSFFETENISFHGEIKQVEDLFFYFLLENPVSREKKKAVSSMAEKFGWRISLQGRKLYFMPKGISKGDALSFICNQIGTEALAGSGDSILDLDFLVHCTYRYIPNHGELISDAGTRDFNITKNRGILAGEEILSELLAL
jgi:hydroxymethylpyrimidine pyrophosphatase-like HAD family hydrolase